MSGYYRNILWALLLSILLHLGTIGLYARRDALPGLPLPHIASAPDEPATSEPEEKPPTLTFVEPPRPRPRPKRFMETHEDQPQAPRDADVPPPDTPFYGVRTTVAANPENPTGQIGDLPYVDGEQDQVLSARTIPLRSAGQPIAPPRPPPLEPEEPDATPPAAEPAEQEAVSPEPEEAPSAPATPEAQEPTLADESKSEGEPTQLAMAETTRSELAPPATVETDVSPAPAAAPGGDLATTKGLQSRFGVARTGAVSFDVLASDFAEYDREMFKAIQQNWFRLVRGAPHWRPGFVRMSFALYADGRIGNVRRLKNTTDEVQAMWCRKAIDEAAPFGPVPAELQALMNNQPRIITINFFY